MAAYTRCTNKHTRTHALLYRSARSKLEVFRFPAGSPATTRPCTPSRTTTRTRITPATSSTPSTPSCTGSKEVIIHLVDWRWGFIICKQSVRWQHLSWMKNGLFCSKNKKFRQCKTLQAIIQDKYCHLGLMGSPIRCHQMWTHP